MFVNGVACSRNSRGFGRICSWNAYMRVEGEPRGDLPLTKAGRWRGESPRVSNDHYAPLCCDLLSFFSFGEAVFVPLFG